LLTKQKPVRFVRLQGFMSAPQTEVNYFNLLLPHFAALDLPLYLKS
jgi:hypothetical protein